MILGIAILGDLAGDGILAGTPAGDGMPAGDGTLVGVGDPAGAGTGEMLTGPVTTMDTPMVLMTDGSVEIAYILAREAA